jgi:uncharacterized protein involved in copper resistance
MYIYRHSLSTTRRGVVFHIQHPHLTPTHPHTRTHTHTHTHTHTQPFYDKGAISKEQFKDIAKKSTDKITTEELKHNPTGKKTKSSYERERESESERERERESV